MGKHTKRNNPVTSRSFADAEPEAESFDDQIDFDFLDLGDDTPLSEVFDMDGAAPAAETADTAYAADSSAEPIKEAAETAVEQAAPADGYGAEQAGPEPAQPDEQRETPRKTAPKKKPLSPEARAKRARERSKRKFRRGLLAYVIILLVLIAGTLVFEWISLDRSQQRLDAEAAAEAERLAKIAEEQARERALYRAPQLAFEDWLSTADADYWTDAWFAANEKSALFESRDAVRSYLEALFADAQAFKALEYTAQAPVYVLKSGDETLAKIFLTGSGLDWNVSDAELLITGRESASARVATGSRVFCNGVELSGEYVVNSDSYFKFDPLRDKLVNPVTWDTYEVDGLLLKPELTAEPPAGGIVTETAEGDFLLCLDAAAGKTYADRAVTFVQRYLYYYMSGSNNLWGNLYNVRILLVPGTNAHTKMGETADGVYWNSPHYNIDTSNVTAGDVVIWADNCYSVDVAFVATGVQNGQDDSYDASMRVYFENINGTFVISDFELL